MKGAVTALKRREVSRPDEPEVRVCDISPATIQIGLDTAHGIYKLLLCSIRLISPA